MEMFYLGGMQMRFVAVFLFFNSVVHGQIHEHAIWDQLVKKYVSAEGKVNYKGFIQDKTKLNKYLGELSAQNPDAPGWSNEQKLAFWINAYNAFTVKLIVEHYPLKSIKDLNPVLAIPTVNTIWQEEFFTINGKKTSLDDIEHSILRKEFDEPRIHFAINCASVSCPSLRNEAFVAGHLEDQLQKQAIRFINDARHNRITKNEVKVSQVFNWFVKDFTKQGTLIEYLNQYVRVKADRNASVSYLKYDWRLNE